MSNKQWERLWTGSGAPPGPALGGEGRSPRSTRRASSLSFGTGVSGRLGVYTTNLRRSGVKRESPRSTKFKWLTSNASRCPQFSSLPGSLRAQPHHHRCSGEDTGFEAPGFPVRHRLVTSTSPWKRLAIASQSVVQSTRTRSCSLVIFSSACPMKTLFLPIDKGLLYIWQFAILEALNWDSGVSKSFLK